MWLRTVVVAALLCSPSLPAQTCSGGIDGGMDATGCGCNTPSGTDASQGPVASTAPAQAMASARSLAWARGIEAYDDGRYREAMPELVRAAQLGEARAADMLALMYHFGERLYGAQVPSDPARAARFAELAVELRRKAQTRASASEAQPHR